MALNFAASIDRSIQRIQKEVNDRCYKITIELFLRIVALSPAPNGAGGKDSNSGTTAEFSAGLLVNQWYPAIGNVWSIERSTATNDTGEGSKARIRGLRGGGEFYAKDGRATLANNIPYAYRAEVDGWPANLGWSGKTGPYRMVALSLQEIAARYK